jgi:hypothetical protein
MAYQVISEAPLRYDGNDGRAFLGGFGKQTKPTCPPFKFVCTCPLPDQQCSKRRQDLCDRILGAARLATTAARLLDPKTITPVVTTVFRQVFDQAPTDKWEVPGNPSRTIAAGELVARRFRAVANELLTSDTTYECINDARCMNIKSGPRCIPGNGHQPEVRPRLNGLGIIDRPVTRPDPLTQPTPAPASPSASCHPTDTIVVDTVAMALLCRNHVLLCPNFWTLKKLWQEGTILHEMFHLCFGLTCSWFQHDQKERKRNSAYCYEVFASGGAAAADPASVSACKALPK